LDMRWTHVARVCEEDPKEKSLAVPALLTSEKLSLFPLICKIGISKPTPKVIWELRSRN
jgi:hypothetical protein